MGLCDISSVVRQLKAHFNETDAPKIVDHNTCWKIFHGLCCCNCKSDQRCTVFDICVVAIVRAIIDAALYAIVMIIIRAIKDAQSLIICVVAIVRAIKGALSRYRTAALSAWWILM